MEKQKTRDEIKNDYKWDLTSIYKSDELWYEDYNKAKQEIKKINDYTDFLNSSKNLKEYLEYDNYINRFLGKLYFYAHLNHDADTTNSAYQKMYNLIDDLFNEYNKLSSFVIPTFMKTDYKIIEKYYEEEPILKEYKFNIDDIYRYKEHTLDEKTEQLITNFNKVLDNPENIYKSLTDSDIKFGIIKDENDNDVELTESNFSIYIKSDNRRVRKETFELMFKTYSEYKNTITSTYSGDIDATIAISKVRNYSSSIEASLYNDNVDISVYNNLIDTVHKNLNVLFKYYDLKQQMLGLDELHLYDIYPNLISGKSKKYTFEEAKELVIESLSILGDDYISNIKKAFDEKWIDVYNNKGKRTGAYSSGFYDTNPYILLNFEGDLSDVSTLAHELGHSMHTYYSCKNNPYQYSEYKIFVAEVASTVNEVLLTKYMINNSNDIEEKKLLLNKLMELFKSTIYRQTMFAEFEKKMYADRENGEVLTNEYISNEYYKIVKTYFGDNVVCDELIKYEWERIPHFYYNFYVYKYATGLSAACYIANSILEGKENALENYLSFLKTGGSMYPIEELKVAGVDMNNPEVIQSAINMFNETIEEFKKLIEK